MNNIQQITNSHNKTIQQALQNTTTNFATAERKALAPLTASAFKKELFTKPPSYKKHTNQKETYVGITEN